MSEYCLLCAVALCCNISSLDHAIKKLLTYSLYIRSLHGFWCGHSKNFSVNQVLMKSLERNCSAAVFEQWNLIIWFASLSAWTCQFLSKISSQGMLATRGGKFNYANSFSNLIVMHYWLNCWMHTVLYAVLCLFDGCWKSYIYSP